MKSLTRPIALVAAGIIGAAVCSTASAQTFIQGTVEHNGGGVNLVNIDAFFSADGDPADLNNDGTDANGDFLTEFLDGPDTYDITFAPPRGYPALPARVDDLFVIGTIDLGTITLADALLLSGKVVDSSNVPLVGVDLFVEDALTGQPVEVAHSYTDGSGFFDLALPAGSYHLFLDPEDSSSPTLLAPGQVLDIALSADTDLGTIALEPGYVLSATCLAPGGGGLPGLDVDIIESISGVKLFTPNDGTDDFGFVDVTVPAGTFDVQFEPNVADKLVAQEDLGVVVNTNLDLGTYSFVSGHYLSGNVEDSLGNPMFDVDLDVFLAGTATEVFVPGSHTDAAGNYQVVVPTGTFDLLYRPDYLLPIAAEFLTSVAISADTVVNVTLPDCPDPIHYGNGSAGSGGFVPTIETIAPARTGSPHFGIQIEDGLGGALCFLYVGFSELDIQGNGWSLLVNPAFRFRLKLQGAHGVPGDGHLTLPSELPDDPLLDGFSIFLQALIIDSGSQGNVSNTDGLEVIFCR